MRRPLAISLVAWVFILAGAAGLLSDLWPLLTSAAPQQLARLRGDGFSDLGPAWTVRLLGIIGGIAVLRGHNWGRWLLVAWMLFHTGLSLFHSPGELAGHVAIFAPLLYLLFRRSSEPFFHGGRATPA